jgi:hypothetical protein
MVVRLAKIARLELKLQAIYVSSLKGLIMSFKLNTSSPFRDVTGIAWSFSSRRANNFT